MTLARKNKSQTQDPETQFWNEVKEKSHSLIADLIEKTLPISAIPSVFKLEKDADFQNLLRNNLPVYYEDSEEYQEKIANQSWTEEDVRLVAEDLTCHYFEIVVDNLVDWLRKYYGFETTDLTNLTV